MLLEGGCSNTGSDTLYVKKMLKVWDIAGMDKILQLYTILAVPRAEIYVLEVFESSKIHCPGDKNLCMRSHWLFFVKITFGHCCKAYDKYMLK